MSTKIEIRLAKAGAIHWTSLEFSGDIAVVQQAAVVPSGRFCLSTKFVGSCYYQVGL